MKCFSCGLSCEIFVHIQVEAGQLDKYGYSVSCCPDCFEHYFAELEAHKNESNSSG